MNIGILVLSILATFITYRVLDVYRKVQPIDPNLPPYLVPQQVGRTKVIQSKTGDASMFVESQRRKAIASQRYCGNTLSLPKKAIRETRTSTGSHTGYLDAFMISKMCEIAPVVNIPDPKIPSFFVFEGGNADTSVTDSILDGNSNGGILYSGGDANTYQPGQFDGGNIFTTIVSYVFDNNLINTFFDGGNA